MRATFALLGLFCSTVVVVLKHHRWAGLLASSFPWKLAYHLSVLGELAEKGISINHGASTMEYQGAVKVLRWTMCELRRSVFLLLSGKEK